MLESMIIPIITVITVSTNKWLFNRFIVNI
jgi:hypothetical protein